MNWKDTYLWIVTKINIAKFVLISAITAPVSAVFGTLAILAVSRGFQDLPKLKKLTEFYTSLARHPSSQQPSAADNFSPFKIREIKQKRLTIVFNGN